MTPTQLKKMINDRRLSALIDALWREYPGLINEKYNRDPEQWLLNRIDPQTDFGIAVGLDNSIEGNQSAAIGTSLITRAFRELVAGSFNSPAWLADPDNWDPLDRLFSLGNGPDADHRSNALEIFKSGLFRVFNALQFSAYAHGEALPADGILQYLNKKLELSFDGQWHELALKSDLSSGTLIHQTAHCFSVGMPVKPTATGWVKTKADSPANAGTVGFVSEVQDADHFRYIEKGPLPGNYIAGEIYFLSTNVAGDLMTKGDPEVWEVGQVREVVGTANVDGTALIVQIEEGEEITEIVLDDNTACEFSFKFEVAEAFEFICPHALIFTSMEHQQANAPVLSLPLNTPMDKFDSLRITPDATGLVILIGEYL